MNPHLSDATLNEYLDETLPSATRAGVAAHLAGCAECARRLTPLRVLFAELEQLPEAPLPRDMRSGVLAALRTRRQAPLRPIADPRRPAFRAIFAAQGLAALALLAFAWPVLAELALPVTPAVPLDFRALAWPLASWPDIGRSGLQLSTWLPSLGASRVPTLTVFFSPAVAGLLLLAAAAFWPLSNSFLLRHRPPPQPRRGL